MKLDALIDLDAASDGGPIDEHIVNALGAFGFVSISYRLTHNVIVYIGTITAHHRDGSVMQWKGIGGTPEEAEKEAIDALAKWANSRPIPYYPTGATP